MRKPEERLIITFPATVMALSMEEKAKENGKEGRIIPVPVKISAGCGLCWSSGDKDIESWKSFMKANNIVYEKTVIMMI